MQWWCDRELTAFGMSHRTAPPEPLFSVGTGAQPLSMEMTSKKCSFNPSVSLPPPVDVDHDVHVGVCPQYLAGNHSISRGKGGGGLQFMLWTNYVCQPSSAAP